MRKDDSTTTEDLLKKKYIETLFAPEDIHLKKIRKELLAAQKWGINVSPVEGQLLHMLVRGFSAKNIIEVGTLFGYSTLWMARALPSDGKIISLEKNSEHHKKATELLTNTESYSQCELLCGDATELLASLSGRGPFDLIFIDADKAGYHKYLDWAEKNIRRNGWIIGDNTFLFGKMLDDDERENSSNASVQSMKNFNKRLSDREKYNSVLFPTTEGMTIAQKLF